MTKRLPPYGNKISAILGYPDRLKTFSGCTKERGTVLITADWLWADQHPRHLTVVLPFHEDPHAFHWGFLIGHEPVLLEQQLADEKWFAEEVATALILDGVGSVIALGNENQTRYRRA